MPDCSNAGSGKVFKDYEVDADRHGLQTSSVSVFDNPCAKFEYWTMRHKELKQELHIAKLEMHMLADVLAQLDSLSRPVIRADWIEGDRAV